MIPSGRASGMTPLSTSRSEPSPASSSTAAASASSTSPRNRCETSRNADHGVWGSSRPAKCSSSRCRRAGRLDLVVDRAGLDARLQAIGQPLQLAVEHQPAAELEDVGACPDQPSGFEHAGLLASGVDHDLDVGPRARFERSGAEQAEAPVGARHERCVGAEQGAVEIHVQAAHRGATVAADASATDLPAAPWREMLA